MSNELVWDLFARDGASRSFNIAAESANRLADDAEQARRRLAELGAMSPSIRITDNAPEEIARLQAVRGEVDSLGSSGQQAGGDLMKWLVPALGAIAPAAIPIAAVAGGAFATLLLGINAAKGALQKLTPEYHNLQLVAGRSLAPGINSILQAADKLQPVITQMVRVFGKSISGEVAGIAHGLENGGLENFIKIAETALPTVLDTVNHIGSALLTAGQALAPIGIAVLHDVDQMSHMLSDLTDLAARAGQLGKKSNSNLDQVFSGSKGRQILTTAMDKLNGLFQSSSNNLGTLITKQQEDAAAAQNAAAAHRLEVVQLQKLTAAYQTATNAALAQKSATLGFRAGLLSLNQQVKTNSSSLSLDTQKGVANRQVLIQLLQSAEQAAQGSRNYSGALKANVQDFINFATKAGFSKGAVDRLLGSLHMMPRQITTRLSVDTSGAIDAVNNAAIAFATAGANAGAAYSAAFRASLRIRSPSKVFEQYGIWIVEGLVKGVKSYHARAVSVMHELALGMVSGWASGTSSLKSALVSPVQAVLNRMNTVVNDAIKRQQAALKTAQGNLKSLLSQRKKDIQSLAGTVSSGADLSGLFGTDALGNPTTENINVFLSAQARQLKKFAKDVAWAARHHLSPRLLAEIEGLGAAQGDQVLQQFMTHQASIREANASFASIQKYATSAATTAEDAIYAKRVAKDRKAVEENSKRLRDLTVALHAVERSTARAAAVHLTVDAKTGKPQVDREFINEIIQGIRRAERIAGKRLL